MGETKVLYRADIDGLRAVAVALIIFYHLGMYPPGGFIGVDVFFVISGFLITTIIVQEIEAGRFSFADFYARRIRRILPALLVMLIVVLAAGAFLLMPGDYEVTGWGAVYAAGSMSNFYFLRHTGYFDVASELMPLLHTWSLGVEEQFYLAWPPILVCIVRIVGKSRRNVGAVVGLLFGISLAWCVYRTHTDPKAAFYLPQTRAWELGTGALLAIVPRSRFSASVTIANAAGIAGLGLILWSAFSLPGTSPFPGYNALPPIAGAALLITPWRATGLIQRALSQEPLTFLGRISYSLYLWHWPIIVLYRHFELGAPLLLLERVALAAVTLVAAWTSWAFVEEPFRRSRWTTRKSIEAGITAAIAVALVGLGIANVRGFPERAPDVERYASPDVMWDWNCPHPEIRSADGAPGSACILGAGTSEIRGVLLGDSHAEHFAPLIDVAAKEIGMSVALFRPGCMPMLGTTSVKRFFPSSPNYNQYCADLMKPVLSYIRSLPRLDFIVLASAWIGYPYDLYRNDPSERGNQHGLELLGEAFDEFFRSLDRPGLKFLVIGDVPQLMPYNHSCLSKTKMILRRPCPAAMLKTPLALGGPYQEGVRSAIRDLPNRWPNVSVLIPHDFMCDDSDCFTMLNGEFLYRDMNHLRRNLSEETKEQFIQMLRLREALLRATALRGPGAGGG
jgi:peptidoglycan/LPS O-acetylase OafA/YrhL